MVFMLKGSVRAFFLSLVPSVKFVEYIFMFLHFMANGYHGQVNPEHKRCSQDLYYCLTVRKLCVQLPHSDKSRCVYNAAAAAAATASLTILKRLFIKVDQCVSSSVLCDYLRRSIYNRSLVDVFL